MSQNSNAQYIEQVISYCEAQGAFGKLEDGFVYLWIEDHGAMSADCLRAIAAELDRRNAEWEKIIGEELDNAKP